MGTDRPDDADASSDDHSDHAADRSGDAGRDGESAHRRDAVRPETRSRHEYYEDLRAATSAEARTKPRKTADPRDAAEPPEQAANRKPWEEVTGWSQRVWAEYQRKWPPEERTSADRSGDPPGSSRGDSDEPPDRSIEEELDQEYEQIAERERQRITPALREIESHDPDRHLVGLQYRLKDRDRIKEKVDVITKALGHSTKEAISLIPDAIRFTFQYEEARYTQGVWADIARMEGRGFKLLTRKNFWSHDQYKGINSQWIDPESGQRFELQFHTRISFEAKQITHTAYEQLRSQPKPDELETMVLRAFQREVSAAIPIPPGAKDIPEYPERGRNAG